MTAAHNTGICSGMWLPNYGKQSNPAKICEREHVQASESEVENERIEEHTSELKSHKIGPEPDHGIMLW